MLFILMIEYIGNRHSPIWSGIVAWMPDFIHQWGVWFPRIQHTKVSFREAAGEACKGEHQCLSRGNKADQTLQNMPGWELCSLMRAWAQKTHCAKLLHRIAFW